VAVVVVVLEICLASKQSHLLKSLFSSGELKLFANIFADEIGY
jgi:hypothetical protein